MTQPTSPSSRLEQAAIVLLSMGEEPAAAVLRCLSREELLEVTSVMSRMSGIKVDTVKSSLQRFFDDYREQSGVHGASRSFLQRSLDIALGSDIARSVLNSIYGDAIRPKLARLQWTSSKWLAECISQEHVRMQSVFLAFLPPALASEVIAALPAAGREAVLLHMAKLTEVDRELLAELEELVDRFLQSLDLQGTNISGVRQVAEILNRLPDTGARLVERLREQDTSVAEQVERSMYDFYLLSRQTEPTLRRIIDDVPPEQWALALKGAEPALREAILRPMPRRQIDSLDELMRRIGPVPRSRIEQARREIMDLVKTLADAGEIELQLFAEAVVE